MYIHIINNDIYVYWMYVCMYVCMYVYYVCPYVHMYVCMNACMFVCACSFVYVGSVYVCVCCLPTYESD